MTPDQTRPTDFVAALSLPTPLDEPWLPLSTESAQDYCDFRFWLSMRPRPKVTYLVALRNDWEGRALAWDQHCHDHPEAVARTAEDRQKEDADLLHVLKHTLKGQAVKLFAQLERASSPVMTLEGITKCADVIVKLERLVHGQSTENVSQHTTVNLEKLSADEIRLLDAMTAKAEGEER